MRFSSLLLVALAQLLPVASAEGIRAGERSRQLQDRTDAFDRTELDCQLNLQHEGEGNQIERIEFEYWYAMGTRGTVDSTEMNVLESKLFQQSMQGGMVWCTSENKEGVPIGGGRYLEVSPEDEAARKLFTQKARELGIIAVNSGPTDTVTELECPANLNSIRLATGATECKVVIGRMGIVAHKADNVSYLVASLRDATEKAMSNTVRVTGSDVPNISFLAYLGDDEFSAISGGVVIGNGDDGSGGGTGGGADGGNGDGSDGDAGGGNNNDGGGDGSEGAGGDGSEGGGDGNAGGGSNGNGDSLPPSESDTNSTDTENLDKGNVIDGVDGTDTGLDEDLDKNGYVNGDGVAGALIQDPLGEDDGAVGLILGVTIPLVVGLILAALFIQKRRDTMTAAAFHDLNTSDFVVVGTGDAPSSFHEGLYHYMRDGTRYLSTRCETCLETRMNGFYTDNDLGTIMEGEEFQDTSLLGAKNTSTMDVHKCASALCKDCNPTEANQTTFLTPLNSEHTLFADIHMTGASPRASDHMEV